jgi:Xaa-Pro aminopeptidase
MTAAEIAWLDAYHATVREKLSALVDDETRTWLDRATRPLGSNRI